MSNTLYFNFQKKNIIKTYYKKKTEFIKEKKIFEMATCEKTKTFPKGKAFIFSGCDEQHAFKRDEVFQCGYSYELKPCTNKHIWTCLDCAEGKRATLCKGLISVTKNEKIHFKACSHNAAENTTLRCGTKVECIDASGCNQDQTFGLMHANALLMQYHFFLLKYCNISLIRIFNDLLQ